MSSVKSPNLKKQLRLDRDHRVEAEYPKAFRKNWPKKKANGKRRLRRAQERMVHTATARDALDGVASDVRSGKLANPLRKYGVASLRKAIERKRERRLRVARRQRPKPNVEPANE
jgi:hypothetical protein